MRLSAAPAASEPPMVARVPLARSSPTRSMFTRPAVTFATRSAVSRRQGPARTQLISHSGRHKVFHRLGDIEMIRERSQHTRTPTAPSSRALPHHRVRLRGLEGTPAVRVRLADSTLNVDTLSPACRRATRALRGLACFFHGQTRRLSATLSLGEGRPGRLISRTRSLQARRDRRGCLSRPGFGTQGQRSAR